MANFYPYLISSLPMLHFGTKAPFSFEEFLQKCFELIPEPDFKVLSELPKTDSISDENLHQPTISKWIEFDTDLRNELIKIRVLSKHLDPQKYLRREKYCSTAITQGALAAINSQSIIEGEKILDQLRWDALEEFSSGHYFDMDFLIIYAYKLLLLRRWDKVNSADKENLLEKALQNN